MNAIFKNRYFYFFMAAVTAAVVPALASAQSAPDSADGPQMIIITDPSQVGGGAPAAQARGGSGLPTSYWYAGGMMGSGTQQVFQVAPTLGHNGEGTRFSAMASLGYGRDIGAIRGDLWGLRTNGYNLSSFTVAALVNGSAGVGTSGDGTANGVVAAAMLIPVVIDGTHCAVAVGPAAGGTYSNHIAGEGVKTASAGPGAYLGGWCQSGGFRVMLTNHVIGNSINATDSLNPTLLSGQSRLGAWYQLNENMAIGAHAAVDYDYREGRPHGIPMGGLELVGTFGGSSSSAAR